MEALVEGAAIAGVDLDGRSDYSGRGMFGRETCAAVVASIGDLVAAAAAAAFELTRDEEVDHSAFLDDLKDLRADSRGNRIVVY